MHRRSIKSSKSAANLSKVKEIRVFTLEESDGEEKKHEREEEKEFFEFKTDMDGTYDYWEILDLNLGGK